MLKWNLFSGAKKPANPEEAATPQSESRAVRSTAGAFDRVVLPAAVGVTWGGAYDSVMRHIRAQRWTIDAENSNTVNVFVRDADVNGHTGSMLAFRFYNNALFGVTIGYHDIAESRAIDEYNMVKMGLAGKYGQPKEDNHWFEKPFVEGDGRAVEAIRAGKAHFSTVWYFDNNRHGIMLKLNSYMHIMVKYEDSEVAEQSVKG